ncbi:MAG: S8 family serine peptidase, partial [Bacteroidota bacterium]
MAQSTSAHSRTLVFPAFGLLFCLVLLLLSSGVFAQTVRPKLVTIGAPRTVRLAGQLRLQPQLAVADRIVVQFSSTPAPAGVVSVQGKVSGRVGRGLGLGMYTVELPEGTDVVSAARDMRGRRGVLLAEPDILTYPALVPNDTEYAKQFHLPQIKAPLAWDITTGKADVVIAVIDSGLYLAHPDVAGKIWTNTDEIAGNRIDDDHNGFIDDVRGWDFYDNNNDPNPSPNGIDEDYNGTPDEQVNHGTLVAGTAAAIGNDAYGCAGVCWGGKIMPLQVFPDDGGTAVSNVVEAINYAVANGADVINLSIGGGYTELFTAPITAAYNAGVVVVTAGGNEGSALTDSPSTWASPVCNDGSNVQTDNHLIGVGAVDRFDRLASFSNFDASTTKHYIDIVAPGEAIYGIAAYFPSIPGFNSYYQTNSGTSFSAPIISGLVGLLVGMYPSATPAEIIEIVRNAGDNIDSLNPGYAGKMGGGRINCAAALGVAMPPATVQDLAAADTSGDDGGSITVTWRKSPDDGGGSGKVTGYMLFRREGATGTFVKLATLAKGTEIYTDAGVTDGTQYYYKVRTTDGTLTSDTAIVGPATSSNDAPPAQVAGLVAYDRPADSGKAIVIGWSSYTAPADFARYSIYRSSADFASTG